MKKIGVNPTTLAEKASDDKCKTYFIWSFIATCLAAVVIVGIIVLIATVRGDSSAVLQRVCGVALGTNVPLGGGEANAQFTVRLAYDLGAEKVEYRVTQNTGSSITAIRIMGPLVPGTSSGPLFSSLCGFPSTACDTLTTPGQVVGSATSLNNLVDPLGSSIKPLLYALRDNQEIYYLEVLTTDKPNSPGAARLYLGTRCN
jgi:hypothetical protein